MAGAHSERLYRVLLDDASVAANSLPEAVVDHVPPNAVKQVGAHTLQKVGDLVVDAKTVLAWLLAAVGAPAGFVALLVPIRDAGSMLPQVFAAPWGQATAGPQVGVGRRRIAGGGVRAGDGAGDGDARWGRRRRRHPRCSHRVRARTVAVVVCTEGRARADAAEGQPRPDQWAGDHGGRPGRRHGRRAATLVAGVADATLLYPATYLLLAIAHTGSRMAARPTSWISPRATPAPTTSRCPTP